MNDERLLPRISWTLLGIHVVMLLAMIPMAWKHGTYAIYLAPVLMGPIVCGFLLFYNLFCLGMVYLLLSERRFKLAVALGLVAGAQAFVEAFYLVLAATWHSPG